MQIPMTKELDVLMRESIKREWYGGFETALHIIYDLQECAEERFLKNPCADNEEKLYELDSIVNAYDKETMKNLREGPLSKIKEEYHCLRRYCKQYRNTPGFRRCLRQNRGYFIKKAD